MPRIAVVTQHFWPTLGGAEVFLHRLAGEWTRLGNKVAVLTCRSDAQAACKAVVDECRVDRITVPHARFVGTATFIFKTMRWIRRHYSDFDVVYISMLKHAAFAVLSAGARRVPCVLRAEGGGKTGDVAWQKRALGGNWIRRLCHRADAIIAPSRGIETELLGAGYHRRLIQYIPNGVPIPEAPWRREETTAHRRSLGLPNRPTICYTGRLHREKGLLELIEAIGMLHGNGIDIQLLLIGDGPDRGSLQQRAERLGIIGHVHFPGVVGSVEPFLRASDGFALLSYQEGLSLSLLEALTIGIPSIATDIDANRDLAQEPGLWLVPAGDPKSTAEAIQARILRSDQLPNDSARETMRRRFGIEIVARQHLDLFDRLRQEFKK